MALAIRAHSLIDTAAGETRADPIVAIERAKVVDVQFGRADGVETIDLDGCTLLPGLIDAHTHIGAPFPFAEFGIAGMRSAAEIAARIFAECAHALDAGFTTCREVGGLDGGIVQAVNSGVVRGPRILPSGPALAQHGGHATFMPPYADCFCPLSIPGLTQLTIMCDGADEVRRAARVAFRRGATHLKILATGGVASLTDAVEDSQFSIDEIKAAVDEAKARNTYVTAHAHSLRGMRNAVEAGVGCIEHGTYLDAPTAELMAARRIGLVPTLAGDHLMVDRWQEWGLPRDTVERLSGIEENAVRAIKVARAAGVRIGSGSDMLGHPQMHRGLELVLRANAEDPLTAILAATRVNAEIMKMEAHIGGVTPGKVADVVAVEGDPLRDPEILDDPGRIVFVMKAGQVVKDLRGVAREAARPPLGHQDEL